jgi:LysR family transcriptional regulator, nitrogen assimilation regulatory protein
MRHPKAAQDFLSPVQRPGLNGRGAPVRPHYNSWQMEIRQCRYFIAVVDAQSITRAARKLNVVQSAISHQMANLEQELQTVLLHRTTSGVVPTEAGRVLYLHAQAVLKHVEAARQSIRALDHEVRGTVSLGLPSSTAAILAVPLLSALRTTHPHIELSIIEGLGSVLAEQLATGRLDLSILFDGEALRGFEREPLLSERLHFVSTQPEAHAALRGSESVPLSELARWPLILAPRTNSIRALLEQEAARVGLQLNVVADLSGVSTMLDAVECGFASSVMMAANAARLAARADAVVLPISSPVIERTASLFHSEHFPVTPATGGLREVLLDVVGDMVSQQRWAGARLAR